MLDPTLNVYGPLKICVEVVSPTCDSGGISHVTLIGVVTRWRALWGFFPGIWCPGQRVDNTHRKGSTSVYLPKAEKRRALQGESR